MEVVVYNNYYDVNDASKPIKSRTITAYSALNPIDISANHFVDVDIKRSDYQVHGSWIEIFQPETLRFYTLDVSLNSIARYDDNSTIYPLFSLSPNVEYEVINSYETNVINLIDVFGLVGGLFELLQVISGIFISYITSILFKKDLATRKSDESESLFTHPPYKQTHVKIEEQKMVQEDSDAMMQDSQNPFSRAKSYLDRNANQEVELLQRK